MVFPIEGDVSEVLTVHRAPMSILSQVIFMFALSGSVARKAIKQDFTPNYSPGMKFDDLQKIPGD